MPDYKHKAEFKVIIVGGSIAGLALAHALSHIDIDFVVLESRSEISPPVGASVCLLSHGLRILDQLGMLDSILEAMTPIGIFQTWWENGQLLTNMDTPKTLEERHGYPIGWIQRQRLLQILFSHLQAKETVLLGKRFVKASHDSEGVTAHCTDGTSFRGNILVGADGVHSAVRKNMWRQMEEIGLKKSIFKDTNAMTCQYSCVYGVSSPITGIEECVAHRTFGTDYSFLLTPGVNGAYYWFLFAKLETHGDSHHIPRFDRSELSTHIRPYLDIEVAPNIKLSYLYENSTTCHLTPLEEASYDRWVWKDTACLGDSIHKMTPNLGQGANTAIENGAALANSIASMLESHESPRILTPEIHDMLSSWASSRKERTDAICLSSNALTRIEALATWRHRLVAMRVLPYMGDIVAFLATRIIVGSEKLKFLPEPKRALAGSMRFKGQEKSTSTSVLDRMGDAFLGFVGPTLTSISLYCLG